MRTRSPEEGLNLLLERSKDMTIYDKAELLANYLNVPFEEVKIWSDNSLTVHSLDFDYSVSSYKRKHQEPLSKVGRFYIYKN